MKLLKDYLNRDIRVTDERIQHIIENHPEFTLNDFNDKLKNTLENPDIVMSSSSDPTVELFYRFFQNTPVGNKWFCIVIKNLATDLFVITLYYTDSIKKGKEIWEKI